MTTPTKSPRHRMDRPTKRALIILVVVVATLAAFGVAFEREIVGNCRLLNRAHVAFDATLDQLARNAETVLKNDPARKAEALRVYRHLHLPLQNCPPAP